jgi:hypothetical protein
VANLNDNIEGGVLGDNWTIKREITGIPDGQTVVKSWLTVKEALDDDPNDTLALFQKEISTVASASGQITDPGSGAFPDRRAEVLFLIVPANTFAWEDNDAKEWDVQIKLSGGAISTEFRGKIKGTKGVTNKTL